MVGPGSEWFWAMAQFVLVAVTIVGLYRQVRQQNAANALERMVQLQGEWNSPRMIYARICVARWRMQSTDLRPDVESTVPLAWLCNFFENLADLFEAGHVTWSEVENTWGQPLVLWWSALRETVMTAREETSTALLGFERLADRAAATARKRGDDWDVSADDLPTVLGVQIERNATRLRMLRDIERLVIPGDAA